jgi:hypothetical protein
MSVYSGYNTKEIRNPKRLKALLDEIMDVTAGHDHDGENSKAVEVGTVADGAITKAKFAAGALAADATGRAVMATNLFDNATTDAKFAASAFAADADSRAKFADGIWTLAKMAATANYRILNYQVEDLAAGVDIADRVIFAAPTGLDVTLVKATIIPQGDDAGIDSGNKCVIKLSDGTNTIVEKEYDDDPAFPDAAVEADLGALQATYKVLSAGEKLYLSVTNGAAANPPAFMLQVVYSVADAV